MRRSAPRWPSQRPISAEASLAGTGNGSGFGGAIFDPDCDAPLSHHDPSAFLKLGLRSQSPGRMEPAGAAVTADFLQTTGNLQAACPGPHPGGETRNQKIVASSVFQTKGPPEATHVLALICVA